MRARCTTARRTVLALLAGLCAAALGGCGSGDGSADAPIDYMLTFTVKGEGRFGALQFDVEHLGNSGGFIGDGDRVECVPLVDAIMAANYVGARLAKFGFISLAGVDMPASLAECRFRTSENLGKNSFRIEVTDAADTVSRPIDPAPEVVITRIAPD